MRREDELAANLTTVRDRIRSAAEAVDRDEESVTLVVITKTWPAKDVRILLDLGVRHVGENKDQEAAPKARDVGAGEACWHFVGQLQTNKARSVATYADVVESVDRLRLVSALDKAAIAAERDLCVLIQVALETDLSRGGAPPEHVLELAEVISSSRRLSVGGVMAVAPLGAEPLEAFDRLARVSGDLRAQYPRAAMISAGMSADLEAAVACGATHVRIGSAVLGHRPAVG